MLALVSDIILCIYAYLYLIIMHKLQCNQAKNHKPDKKRKKKKRKVKHCTWIALNTLSTRLLQIKRSSPTNLTQMNLMDNYFFHEKIFSKRYAKHKRLQLSSKILVKHVNVKIENMYFTVNNEFELFLHILY